MPRFASLVLKIVCLALLGLIGLETFHLALEEAPLAGISPAAPEARAPRALEASSATPVPLPERYATIDSSGIFGLAPKVDLPPALLGLVGKYAILRASDGRKDLVAEGGELGGIKLLRIGINRALIEYKGKQEELTLFSGLGSGSLIAPAAGPTDEKQQDGQTTERKEKSP